jgi:hypothetical protein
MPATRPAANAAAGQGLKLLADGVFGHVGHFGQRIQFCIASSALSAASRVACMAFCAAALVASAAFCAASLPDLAAFFAASPAF